MNERRAQDDTSRLARLVLRDQLEVIREALIRRGKSEWIADDIVKTIIEEFQNGDPASPATGIWGLREEGWRSALGLRERQIHREASREGGTLLRAANRG